MSRIVVGVDGSKNSIAALRFALAEARVRGSEVEVIHAWRMPSVLRVPGPEVAGYAPVTVRELEQMASDLRRRAEDLVSAAIESEAGGLEAGSEVGRSRATPPRCSSEPHMMRICSWSAPAGAARSPRPSSAPSAATVPTGRAARS